MEWIGGVMRSLWKVIVHIFTGKCEIERICRVYPHTLKVTERFDECFRRSKRLKDIHDSKVMKTFDSDIVASEIVQRKRITFSNVREEEKFFVVLTQCLDHLAKVNLSISAMEQKRHQSFDEDDESDIQLLDDLWRVFMGEEVRRKGGRFTKEWQELGFQGSDPVSDLRGMGVLPLYGLVYFGRNHETDARRVLLDSKDTVHWYPFALAAIHLSDEILRLSKNRVLNGFFYTTSTSEPLNPFCELFCTLLFLELKLCFSYLSARVFVLYNEFWKKNKGYVMEFNSMKERFFRSSEWKRVLR